MINSCNLSRLCFLITKSNYGRHFKFLFLALIIQVEVKIDNSCDASKDRVLENYTIEAALYDTGSWYNFDGHADLLGSHVANIKLSPSTTRLGFHGYVLGGRLESPRLWSAEQVRELT